MDDFVNNAQKGIGKLFFWKKNKKTDKNENKKIILNNENLNINKKENKMTIKTEKNQNKNYNFDLDDDEEEEQTTSNSNKNFLNEINNDQNDYFEEEEDSILNAHRVFTKKSFLDIEGMPYVPFIKIKKTENFLSIFGIKKNIQFKEIKYLVLFDEHFIYMINMTIKENNQNNFFKKIGNHFDLKKLTKIDIKDDQKNSNIKIITLLFVLDNDVNNFKSKIKEFYFDYENGIKFFKILKFYLKKNNIPISFMNNNVENVKVNNENDNKEDEKKDVDDNLNNNDNKKEDELKKDEKKEDENQENNKKEEEKKEEIKEENNKKEEKKEEEKIEEKKEEEKKEEIKEENNKNEEEKIEEKKEENNKKEEENNISN
jgi:hypothetical protein